MNDVLIDTNIRVYAYDSTQGEKHQKANALVLRIFSGDAKTYIANQNLAELFITLISNTRNPMPKEMVEHIVVGLVESKNWIKISADPVALLYAMKIYRKGFHFWDCLIAATALENFITTIYTENVKDFEKIPGIKVVNPLL